MLVLVMKSCQDRCSHLTPPPTSPPNPFHLAPPQRSLLIRRHRSKNPGSVGHKHGPRIESVFKAQNWDRVRKWCKISGPDSGHKNSGATSSFQPTSWLEHINSARCSIQYTIFSILGYNMVFTPPRKFPREGPITRRPPILTSVRAHFDQPLRSAGFALGPIFVIFSGSSFVHGGINIQQPYPRLGCLEII